MGIIVIFNVSDLAGIIVLAIILRSVEVIFRLFVTVFLIYYIISYLVYCL